MRETPAELATLTAGEGYVVARLTRLSDHPPAEIWRAITDPAAERPRLTRQRFAQAARFGRQIDRIQLPGEREQLALVAGTCGPEQKVRPGGFHAEQSNTLPRKRN